MAVMDHQLFFFFFYFFLIRGPKLRNYLHLRWSSGAKVTIITFVRNGEISEITARLKANKIRRKEKKYFKIDTQRS